MIRGRREVETFELTCHVCHCTVEIPCRAVSNQIGTCTRCGARLVIVWRTA